MAVKGLRPIVDAIRGGAWKTALGTGISAAVSFGVLDTREASALNTVVAALVTIVTALTSVVAQLHILRNAEPQVTPVVEPRDNAGHPLIPAVPPPTTPIV
jgi:phosphatidylglycerophosphate synthase